ncbi:MAG: ATP-binding protein [Chloracidobacterium sp.]|nr:ATP-binding protein [Chloracidobacterium sp.]MDW8216780.1 two-component regulator propeller domain-containing protein [Acidobacteriota bacterium]
MKGRWTAWLAGVVFLILSILGEWRQAAAHPEPAFRRLNQAHGLSNNGVLALLQDRQGFIWIATEDGLNRYDGVEFKIFRIQEDGRTPTFTVCSLYESRDGVLWVGTNARGLARFDRWTETFSFITEGLPVDHQGRYPRIEAILEDNEGVLWIGSWAGIGRLTPDRRRILPYTLGSETRYPRVTAIAQDTRGRLWFGGMAGLWRLSPPSMLPVLRHTFPNNVQEQGVRSLCLVDDMLYVGGWQGLYVVDTATERLLEDIPGRRALAGAHINVIRASLDKQWLWLGTGDGLLRYHRQTGEVVKIQSDPRYATSLGGNDVRSLLVDRTGALWVGDGGYGISLYAPSTQRFHWLHHDPFEPNSLSGNFIRGLAEAPDGTVWVATQYDGVNQVDLKTGRVVRYEPRADNTSALPAVGWVWAVCVDHRGEVWLGTKTGVYRLDARWRRFVPVPNMPRASVHAIFEDRRRNLWFGFGSDGLYCLADDRRTLQVFQPAAIQMPPDVSDGIQCLYEDRAGRIWVGYENAVSRLDPVTQEVRVYTHRELGGRRADGFYVVHVNEDQSGNLWVSTKGLGVHRYDAQTDAFVEHLTTANGLPHDNAYGVLPDDDSRLWISTDRGLVCYNPVTKHIEIFGLGSGLQGLEFNRAAVLKLSSGALLFGGPNGLNWFFPRDIKRSSDGPPVAITEARTLDRALPITPQGLTLQPDDRALTLKFVALDFSAPEENRYAYRLIGFDRDWRLAAGALQATYTNLPPGEYVFRVKAANPDGVWNETGVSVLIRVQAPWWRTWWASILYTCAGGVALILAFRFQAHRLGLAAALREAELRATLLARENRQRAESEALLRSKNEALALANAQLEASKQTIEAANAQLREANERLQELDRIKQGFTAMLVHDLKSPLAVVLATLEFLEMQNEGDADALELIQAAKTNVANMTALITELLEVFRAEAQDIQLSPHELDVTTLLHQCIAAAQIMAREKNIEVQPAIPSNLPLIRADGKKLERVFMNLLSNAIKFTPAQGMVTVEAAVFEGVGVEVGKRYIQVSITDTGPGIPAEELPYIFDPYRQSNTQQRSLGVGLGLSIVRRIMAAHGGTVSVRSQVGVGSTFTVIIPVAETSGAFALSAMTGQVARRTPTGICSHTPNKNEPPPD